LEGSCTSRGRARVELHELPAQVVRSGFEVAQGFFSEGGAKRTALVFGDGIETADERVTVLWNAQVQGADFGGLDAQVYAPQRVADSLGSNGMRPTLELERSDAFTR